MLQIHRLYVANTYIICCKDKKHGARAGRARRGFFLPNRDIVFLFVIQAGSESLCSSQCVPFGVTFGDILEQLLGKLVIFGGTFF